MIGKMRVFRQQRTMQVGAKGIAVHSPLGMIFRVVAVPLEDAPKWFGCAQVGAPTMIFKTNQRAAVPGNCDIADAAWNSRPFMNGPCIEDTQAAHIRAVCRAVVMRQQLVPAAD